MRVLVELHARKGSGIRSVILVLYQAVNIKLGSKIFSKNNHVYELLYPGYYQRQTRIRKSCRRGLIRLIKVDNADDRLSGVTAW